MMNTLVSEPFPSCLEKFFDTHEIRKIFFSYKDRSKAHAFERGEISEADFLKSFYSMDLDIEIRKKLPDPYKIKNAIFENISYLSGMREILEGLQKNKNCKTGIASNYSEWYDFFLTALPELKDCDYLFFSCEMGVRKPDPLYYKKIHLALKEKNPTLSNGASILFIDDRLENLEGSKEEGWQLCLHKNTLETKKCIEYFLDN